MTKKDNLLQFPVKTRAGRRVAYVAPKNQDVHFDIVVPHKVASQIIKILAKVF